MRETLAAALLGLATAGVVATAPTAGDPSRLVGTWRGDYDEGEGSGLPGAALTVAMVDGQPRVAVVLYRHVKAGSGAVETKATGLPVIDQSIEGAVLRMRTRDDNFRFGGGDRESVDYRWEFEMSGADEGWLRVVSNSRFEAEKKRSGHAPSPPPPMKMIRDR
jgi:hypothetical protein